VHIVKQRETLSSIAMKNGFSDFHAILDHSNNTPNPDDYDLTASFQIAKQIPGVAPRQP